MTRGGATSPFAVAHLPIDELRPDPANPRRIDEAELDALERSLRQFGARERREAWRLWRSVVDGLADDVRVETEGRAELERRYLGGHPVLFADAATAWAGQVEQVERLARLAEVIRPSE